MPPAPETLPELIEQLGRTYSPFERLKIIGRAWGLLRKMTSQERLLVAAQLGLDNADEVVEAIAARSGSKASPVVLSMIEQAQQKGMAHLPELVADLRDPSRRAERLRQGAAALEGALTGEAPGPKPPPLPARPASPPRSAAPPRSTAPPKPAPPPKPGPLLPMEAMPSPKPHPAPVAVEPAPPVLPEPPAAPPPQPAPAVPPPQVMAEPAVAPAPAPPTASPPKPRPEPEPAQPEEIAVPGPLTARFRQLRRSAADAKGASVSRLRALVEGFPDGWARRRALLELLRAGAAPALRDALSLVETLSSERDRLWCLGTLAESRKISEGDRDAFLATVATPTARRRLERRLGEG